MTVPDAWGSVPLISMLHARVRQRYLRAGFSSERAMVGGFDLHYYAKGPEDAATTVVLVHGLGDSSHTWYRVLGRVADGAPHRRVIALDLPGHGYSALPERQEFASILDHVAALEAFISDVLPARKVVLVGHSLGGWVCVKLAAKRGDLLARLVLVESAGLPYEDMQKEIDLLRVTSAADVRRLWATACHNVPWELRFLPGQVARVFQSPRIVKFIEHTPEGHSVSEEEARSIAVPTLLVWGRNDGLVPTHVGERYAQLIPGARLRWIEECGHAPQLEQPKALLAVLEEGISGVAPDADEAEEATA